MINPINNGNNEVEQLNEIFETALFINNKT